MHDLLPGFVDRLLDQGSDPGEIPEVPVSSATGWLGPLAARILSVPSAGTHRPADAFLAHGYVHLPLPAPDGRPVYLRLGSRSAMVPWPVLATSVVLTVAGSVALEMYQEVADSLAGRPQYARSFGPEQVFAVHPGTQCATQSSPGGVQVLAAASTSPRVGTSLTGDAYAAAVQRARWVLEGLAHGAPAGDRR
ncbi:hypothetical protein [Streptomyces sp. GESEQ-35]|uniref:hypothetical protein n=1 Tax=Streptomyces sp. GESEQ-35 TaxID=2812657 RepID=UPI001B33FE8C|nr:hypothetical protein [Streptomyces sp. GESEQ-35]